MTNFIHDTINYKGLVFTFDGNSKITASNGTFAEPKPNAFSLVEIEDCPGSTPTCQKACYVQNLRKMAPHIHDTYVVNSKNIKEVLNPGSDAKSGMELSKLFSDWITKNCKEFRWHVSGDIYSGIYATFIASVCFNSPSVTHWLYTRSLNYVYLLQGIDNLIVNISADKDNYNDAKKIANEFGLRICYFSDEGEFPSDLHPDSTIFPGYSLRGRELENPTEHPWWQKLSLADRKKVCPVDFFGQSENHRCGKCVKCMRKLQDVIRLK